MANDDDDDSKASALRLLLATLAAESVPESLRQEIANVFTAAVGLCQLPPPASSGCPFASAKRQAAAAERQHRTSAAEAEAARKEAIRKHVDRFNSKEASFQEHFSTTDSPALFDMFGGWEGLTAGVSCMYLRLIDDPRTSHFFAGVDYAHLVRHMTIVIGNALLGRVMCDSGTLQAQHGRCRRLGLSPMHVDIMCEHLEVGLVSAGCSRQTIEAAQEILMKYKPAFEPRVRQPSVDGA